MKERMKNLIRYLEMQSADHHRLAELWVEVGGPGYKAFRITYGDLKGLIADLTEVMESKS